MVLAQREAKQAIFLPASFCMASATGFLEVCPKEDVQNETPWPHRLGTIQANNAQIREYGSVYRLAPCTAMGPYGSRVELPSGSHIPT